MILKAWQRIYVQLCVCHHTVYVQSLMYTEPLMIYCRFLPPGVAPDDPRLADARVVSERTYTTDYPVYMDRPFNAFVHRKLINPDESEHRKVRM